MSVKNRILKVHFDANFSLNLRPQGEVDRQALHPLLAISLLPTVIPSINLVLSNPWSVGLRRQERAEGKLRSSRIANEPPDLIFRGKEKMALV